MPCFRKIPELKNLRKREGGGVSRFSVGIFLSHIAEKFRRRILYCCNNFGYRESLDKGGGEYQDFPWKIFCLTVPKNFLVEPFSVSLITGTEKVWIRGGGASGFTVENFLSHSAENFRRAIPQCCNNFGYRKSLDKKGGGHQDIPSKIFCLTVPKNFVGQSFTVAIKSGIEKIWIRVGLVSRFSVENFLSHSAEKFPSGTF